MLADPTIPKTATLWVEVGTLLRWEGNVTGIPRTVTQFLGALSRQTDLRVRLCAFNSWLEKYEETSIEAIRLAPPPPDPAARKRAAAPPKLRPAWRDWIRPLYRILPTDLKNASRQGFIAASYVARFVVRSGWGFLTGLAKGLAWAKGLTRAASRRLSTQPTGVLFDEGDVLFIPGASWDDYGACEALKRLKQKQRLYVVPIVYDVIPAKMPQVCNPLLPQLFDPWIRKLLLLSDLVLTISQYSRRDLIALADELDLPAPPVEVIPLGDAPAVFDHPARPHNLPEETRRFVLSVGTFEARKNHWLLYQAWRRLIHKHGDIVPPLVLAGRPGWGTQDVLNQIHGDPLVRGRIHVLMDVLDEELAWLYANCLFTLYPSHYEGWGLPVAESLANGKHCICSDSSSLPEVGGDLVDYHDPLDAMRCLELVERALFEPDFLPAREARIRQQFQPTSWEACGARIPALLEQTFGVKLRASTDHAEAA